jgi:hypothetical protein
MKLAILIGVTEYSNGLNRLPACKKDVKTMEKVVLSTGEFDQTLCLSDNENSKQTKDKLSDFIAKNKNQQIDELFFYFTGHGDFYENEFYFILSDFDQNKRKQTSLENSEVDKLIKSLSPSLTVKIVDACHSGISYVKTDSAIPKHLEKTLSGYKSCYFMFSSNLDQSSYQNDDLSFFSNSFFNALITHKNTKIRYKEIIDFISDDFENHTFQTPYFVTQSTFTEIFSNNSEEIRRVLSELLASPESESITEQTIKPEVENRSLENIIRENAKQFCSQEEVSEILNAIKKLLIEYELSDQIRSLYSFNYSFNKHDERDDLPKAKIIGNWLKKNDEDYFAEPYEEDVAYEVDVPDYTTLGMIYGRSRTKTKYRTEIVGFNNTSDLDYDLIQIDAIPNHPNIQPFHSTIALIVSKKSFLKFSFYSRYKEQNWSKKKLMTDFQWKYKEAPLKDNIDRIKEMLINELNGFEGYILSTLKDIFKMQ